MVTTTRPPVDSLQPAGDICSLRLCRARADGAAPISMPLPETMPASDMLARLPLFESCGPAFTQALAGVSTPVEISEPGTDLEIGVGSPMLLLRSGQLEIQVGSGEAPTRTVGPGSAVNVAGMLGLWGGGALPDPCSLQRSKTVSLLVPSVPQEPRPGTPEAVPRRRAKSVTAPVRVHPNDFVYDPFLPLESYPAQWTWGIIAGEQDSEPAPAVAATRRGTSAIQIDRGDGLCFFNLCPYAAPQREVSVPISGPGGARARMKGQRLTRNSSRRLNSKNLPLPPRSGSPWGSPCLTPKSGPALTPKSGGSSGALPHSDPPATSFRATTTEKPVSLLEVPEDFQARLKAICEDPATPGDVRDDLLRGLDIYEENLGALTGRWEFINTWAGSTVFGNAMPEIIWLLAEMSLTTTFQEGERIAKEGEVAEASHSQPLIIIRRGAAAVEKNTTRGGDNPVQVIGRVGVGAILGDLCFLSLSVPWPASVRAEIETEALILPEGCLMHFMDLVPGIISSITSRGNDLCNDLIGILPPPHEVLKSLQLFKDCDLAFLEALGGTTWRSIRYCGELVREEGSMDESLYVVEFGQCFVEPGPNTPGRTVGLGDSFGDLMFLNLAETAPNTVRVTSPFAIVLEVSRRFLHKSLSDFPHLLQHFEDMKEMPDSRAAGQWIVALDVFKNCSPEFIRCIAASVRVSLYTPRQTVVVTNIVDACNMYGLKGGHVLAEICGKEKHLPLGCAFGELTMLGIVRKRTATVRARTFCFVLEIPRHTFLRALTMHPQERRHFEELAMKNVQKSKSKGWPMLKDAPPRAHVLSILMADFSAFYPGEVCFRTSETPGSSLLLYSGTASVRDASGEEISVMTAGSTYNHQVFIGMTASEEGSSVVALENCETGQLSTVDWGRIMSEFPVERERTEQQVMGLAVGDALQRHGLTPSIVLRSCILLSTCPETFVSAVCDHLKPVAYPPGQLISEEGTKGSTAFFMIEGVVEVNERVPVEKQCQPGDVYGAAVMLGITKTYTRTVTAVTNCMGLSLECAKLLQLVLQHPNRGDPLDRLADGGTRRIDLLWQRVQSCSIFAPLSTECLQMVCAHGDDRFFSQGQTLIDARSKGFLLVIFAGTVVVEADHGVVICEVGAGCVIGHADLPTCGLRTIGEGGALRVCAASPLVHCALLDSHDVGLAASQFPEQFDPLIDSFVKRLRVCQQFAATRRVWIEQTLLPALVKIPIFQDFPTWLAWEICTRLTEASFAAGTVITKTGLREDSLLILLDGTADAEVSNGTVVGELAGGSFLGEAAVLELFTTRMVTLRATSECRVVELSATALRQALKHERAAQHLEFLGKVVSQKMWQVAQGMPITCMPLKISAEEPCVRVLALQAQHLVLRGDRTWTPAPDDTPSGRYFAVMARGHAQVEMVADSRFVTTLKAGDTVSEGLVSEYKAQLRAVSFCEIYRLRELDYKIALNTVPPTGLWFQDFRAQQKKDMARMRTRLEAARGVMDCMSQKRIMGSIGVWSRSRAISCENARRLKHEAGSPQRRSPSKQSQLRQGSVILRPLDKRPQSSPGLPALRPLDKRPQSSPSLPRQDGTSSSSSADLSSLSCPVVKTPSTAKQHAPDDQRFVKKAGVSNRSPLATNVSWFSASPPQPA